MTVNLNEFTVFSENVDVPDMLKNNYPHTKRKENHQFLNMKDIF